MATAPFEEVNNELEDVDIELYSQLLIPKVEVEVSGSRYVIPLPPPAMAATSGACVFVNENDDEDSDGDVPQQLDETVMVFSEGAVFVEETKPFSIHVPTSSSAASGSRVGVTTAAMMTTQAVWNQRSSQSQIQNQATPGRSRSTALTRRNDDIGGWNANARRRSLPKGKEAKVTCWICGEGYISHIRFQQHMSRVHQVDRPYQCPHCRKRFAKSALLQKHNNASHRKQSQNSIKFNTDPSYSTCTLCEKQFGKRTTFVRHMREKHKMLPDGTSIHGMSRSSKSSVGADPKTPVSVKEELESEPESDIAEGEN